MKGRNRYVRERVRRCGMDKRKSNGGGKGEVKVVEMEKRKGKGVERERKGGRNGEKEG